MNKVIRVLIAGSLVGAAVGLAMLGKKNRNMMSMIRPNRFKKRTRGTYALVKDNTIRFSSAIKDGTEAFSRSLARG